MAEPLEGGTPPPAGREGQSQGQDTQGAAENPRPWGFLEKPNTSTYILSNLDNRQKEKLVSGALDYMKDVLRVKDTMELNPKNRQAVAAIIDFLKGVPYSGNRSVGEEVWRKMSPTRNPGLPPSPLSPTKP